MNNKIPQIQDLYSDVKLAQSNDALMALLNQPPKEDWVKIHPIIANYKYLPIDKIEYLLKKIFKKYRIEIIREGVAFNGVYVIVRVHYLNPITNEFDYHDGIGAKELQVKKGSSAADLAMINSGALAMAFPIAKTVAIKDACDHFGTLFGSDLNRKDVMGITTDSKLAAKSIIDKTNEEATQTAPIMEYKIEHPGNEIPLATPEQAFDIEVKDEIIVSTPSPPPPTIEEEDF